MDNKELKKLMTKVAKGEISKKEADNLIKSKKVPQDKPKRQTKDTHKRKQVLKRKGGLN